ncbi:hypothetical protein JNW90_30565, partial [Micromonospora sp. STR1s_5]|nr:hypothetical protein [Micromonospora sp. STR1s_5]
GLEKKVAQRALGLVERPGEPVRERIIEIRACQDEATIYSNAGQGGEIHPALQGL